MNRARELWEGARPIARKCLEHPFVQGLGNGSLDPARYRAYIAQDAFFLESFARGYAHCLANAPDCHGLYAFRDLLNGVFDELELHRGVAREMDIRLDDVDPLPATLAYTGFLADAVEAGISIGETLAAMTPCMRLYAYLGTELRSRSTPESPYVDWVAAYASEEFQRLATLIESLFERHATGSPREAEYYRRAMQFEFAFFEAAWRQTGR